VIPEVTREEHFHILKQEPDPIGYCLGLYNLKANSNMAPAEFYMLMERWLKRKGRSDVLGGCYQIFKYNSEKFA
jgi:hypothetical protein